MASLHYTASTLFFPLKNAWCRQRCREAWETRVWQRHIYESNRHLLWRKINRPLKKGYNFVNRLNREETKMHHATMVSKFPWISTNYDRKKKTKKLTRMNFLCIALGDKTIARTFLPSFDTANDRLCQEKLLRSRIFETMVTWRYTSPLCSDLDELFNRRLHWMTNCANSLRAGSPVRIRGKFWRWSSHTLMTNQFRYPGQPIIYSFFFSSVISDDQVKNTPTEKKRNEKRKVTLRCGIS